MKTVILFCHSVVDGANNTIGPDGMQLAMEAGEYLQGLRGLNAIATISSLRYGPLTKTVQTALGFLAGYQKADWFDGAPGGVIAGLDDDEMYEDLSFHGMLQVHGPEELERLGAKAKIALETLFNDTDVGTTTAGFFHSPTIELLGYLVSGKPETYPYTYTRKMEALMFEQDDEGVVSLVGKIVLGEDQNFRFEHYDDTVVRKTDPINA